MIKNFGRRESGKDNFEEHERFMNGLILKMIRESEEEKIIFPAIKKIKKNRIKVIGPVSPDASFLLFKKYKFDVIFGMYHDQVLTTFKTLFKYDAINITLGLPYIRISPDHGTAENITGKGVANPKSLIESIKFFSHIK